jgi:DNA-binding transcriptional regulator YiaG
VGQTPRAPSRAHTKSAQATEIRNIRETLRFTHEEMASKLGVRMATYQSYEYGRVRAVPQDVMDRARALLDDQSYSYAREKYGSRSIQDILKEWAARMSVDPTVSDLARMLGINKSTTSRWLDGQVDPTPYELVRLESIVLQQERRLSRAKDATD